MPLIFLDNSEPLANVDKILPIDEGRQLIAMREKMEALRICCNTMAPRLSGFV